MDASAPNKTVFPVKPKTADIAMPLALGGNYSFMD
jgi:hypothetical protein